MSDYSDKLTHALGCLQRACTWVNSAKAIREEFKLPANAAAHLEEARGLIKEAMNALDQAREVPNATTPPT